MKRLQRFPAEAGSVKAARAVIEDVLTDVDPALLASIVLMVSELTTNAILHARTEFTIELETSPEEVRITVSDAGPGDPTLRTPPRETTTGRGLQIVERLADDWGIDDGSPGKSVWFVVRPGTRARVGRRDETAQPPPRTRDISPGPADERRPRNAGRLPLAA